MTQAADATEPPPLPLPVPPPVPEVIPSVTDRFLDHVDESLMPEKENRAPPERYKNRFVQFAIVAMIMIFFLMVATYFVALVLQIPLPDTEIFKTIVDAIVAIIKLFSTV